MLLKDSLNDMYLVLDISSLRVKAMLFDIEYELKELAECSIKDYKNALKKNDLKKVFPCFHWASCKMIFDSVFELKLRENAEWQKMN